MIANSSSSKVPDDDGHGPSSELDQFNIKGNIANLTALKSAKQASDTIIRPAGESSESPEEFSNYTLPKSSDQ